MAAFRWPTRRTPRGRLHKRRLLFVEDGDSGRFREVLVREALLGRVFVLIDEDETAIYCSHCRRFVPISEVASERFTFHVFDKRRRTVEVPMRFDEPPERPNWQTRPW